MVAAEKLLEAGIKKAGSFPMLALFLAAYFVLEPGIVSMFLAAERGEKLNAGDVLAGWQYGLKYFLASAANMVAVALGLVCLILPGVYVFYRFRLFPYFLVDRNCGILGSLGESWAATSGRVLQMVSLDLLGLVVYALGVLCLIVGIVPASAVYRLMWAKFYGEITTVPRAGL
ncbi:hypothetical protein [Thermanaeromonas toyohensis]|uniref:hypothetical protein n=1 Tax=Thermanaeromonas toyohensis TaxID=161154 RepID=UPI0012F4A6C5|nr:hypothetical protein [Thermanaeromonas toyohensis]